jgi:hypothetical protein
MNNERKFMKIYKNLDINNLENEIWKIIEGVPDYYVSNLGRIKSFKQDKINGKILKCIRDSSDYLQIILYKNKKRIYKQVHRLVFENFIEKLEEGYDAHHINEDKEDNDINNLESKPHSDHVSKHQKDKLKSEKHKIKMSNTRKEKFKNGELNFKGENCPSHKLTEKQVVQIKLLLKEGLLKLIEIANIFNISVSTIYDIKYERTWSHVII